MSRAGLFALLLFVSSTAQASTLTASAAGADDATGLFISGQAVPIVFTASGANGETLSVSIQDADGNVVSTPTASVNADPWTGTVTGYNAKLGFYRVFAKLSDGTALAPIAYLPAPGFITYAIIFDPAGRAATVTEDEALFGMNGGFNRSVYPDIMAYLGARWVKDGTWAWGNVQPGPNELTSFAPTPKSVSGGWTDGHGGAWQVFVLPELLNPSTPYDGGPPDVWLPGTKPVGGTVGALNPTYDSEFAAFGAYDATNFPTVYPTRTHDYYEVTWEPDYTWGYNGNPDQFVSMYQVLYPQLKKDPKSLVMGPTIADGFVFGGGSPAGTCGNADEDLAAGLGPYIDIYSMHPYVGWCDGSPSSEPELMGMPAVLATAEHHVQAFTGRTLPMVGTEQGYTTDQDTANDILQAQRLIRQNLMFVGEGMLFNITFYFVDFSMSGKCDYGYFYNLSPSSKSACPFDPRLVSPKPAAPAYAAMTYLVEGRKSVNNVNWLGDTTRGYVFERDTDPSDELLVLWDFSGSAVPVTIDTGAPSVTVYDWMGNAQTKSTTTGSVTVSLTDEPTYIKGVAPSLWGSSRALQNYALGRPVTTSSVDPDAGYGGSLDAGWGGPDAGLAGIPAAGAFAVDGDPWSNESRWLSAFDRDAGPAWMAVDLGQSRSVTEVRFFTGEFVFGSYMNHPNQNLYDDPLSEYRLQRMSDAGWVDIVHRTGNTRAAVDEPFAAVATDQLRLYVDQGVTTQVKLYELEVLGVPADAGTSGASTTSSTTTTSATGASSGTGTGATGMATGATTGGATTGGATGSATGTGVGSGAGTGTASGGVTTGAGSSTQVGGGCSCSTGSPVAGVLSLALLWLLRWRQRRPRQQ